MSLMRLEQTSPTLDFWKDFEDLRRRIGMPFGMGDVFATADWTPSVDVSETDTEYRIRAALPSVDKKDVTVTVENGTLVMRGERKARTEEANERIHRVEIAQGSFYRSFGMPTDADPDKVHAHYHDGMLDVTIHKMPAKKPAGRKVSIQ